LTKRNHGNNSLIEKVANSLASVHEFPFTDSQERLMSSNGHLQPQEWLSDIQHLFDEIESEAAEVANAIAGHADPLGADLMRAQWSRFVGRLTETAVAVSDMLQRATNEGPLPTRASDSAAPDG
jgi:hypothetical protein